MPAPEAGCPSTSLAQILARPSTLVSGPTSSQPRHAARSQPSERTRVLCVCAATVRVGIKGDAECVIQGFSSSLTRLHCIINPAGLPPPTMYDSDGTFQDLPL